ncbi:HAD family hydrolase [Pseudobutyrivibrio xylanivorans]|uniref:HAD family hydrolase n=2 Tax=Pseudobutyrivibrio xylanivorans TaxID=185007 RepID=A0A5P6VR07_PSEXY|nr:HAD family hydrolase [Pseudobutyrivibrio xylanivorans]
MQKMTSDKMRVSFDLDEVLFVYPQTHKTEKSPIFPFNLIFKERLRLGTPDLINELQRQGYEVWVYTSSFRTVHYIKTLFRLYGVRFDGIINATRHLAEVQRDSKNLLPQKMPTYYHISLHVDDEKVICQQAKQYGYYAYRLEEEDPEWKEKIIKYAGEIRERLQKRK